MRLAWRARQLHTSIDKAPEVDDKKPFLVRRAHIIMRKEKSRRQAAKTNKLKKRKVEHFLEITEISIITPARPKRPALLGSSWKALEKLLESS